jgi:uncharacterized protein YabE (DUF348 family)
VTILSAARRARQSLRRGSAADSAPADSALTEAVSADSAPADSAPADSAPGDRSRRRGLRLGAVAAALLVVTGGSVAVAAAHKTVTLDVDGEIQQVSTFAGSVAGLLEDHDVTTDERDVVAPGSDSPLRSGDEIVVRHAHAMTVVSDGDETTVWTTALTADEALTTLALRGDDVRVLASRSGGAGRADLSLRLGEGTVDVVVDGRTESADGDANLDVVLADVGITLGEFDRVHVTRAAGGRLTVVVQRVEVREGAGATEIPFETVVEPTDELYRGQQRTVVPGAVGVLTTQYRIVLVDGAEESRRVLADAVTTAPVTAVVREGTRARPVATGGAVVSGDVWGQLAACESGGNPAAVSRNGLYYGLYQFSLPTWQAMGGAGLPSEASAAEQTQRAQALQARSGWGQWPACAAKLGLI